jgi:hypothetical protein
MTLVRCEVMDFSLSFGFAWDSSPNYRAGYPPPFTPMDAGHGEGRRRAADDVDEQGGRPARRRHERGGGKALQ